MGANGFSLHGVAHPVQNAVPILRQQIRDGGAEAAATQYCDRLLLSHDQSVVNAVQVAGIIRLAVSTTSLVVRRPP